MDFQTKSNAVINQTSLKDLKDYASKVSMAYNELREEHKL